MVVAVQPAPLPEGTLSFFVNGSLECSVNVGPGDESSSCDVILKALGPQRVTTLYSSGSLSSTVTEIDNVEPVPATTRLAYWYEQWTEGKATSKGVRLPATTVRCTGQRGGTGLHAGRPGGPEVKIDAIEPGSSSAEVLWYPLAQIEGGGHYLRYESHYVSGYGGSGTIVVLGGGTQAIYIAKTLLAFSPRIPSVIN